MKKERITKKASVFHISTQNERRFHVVIVQMRSVTRPSIEEHRPTDLVR